MALKNIYDKFKTLFEKTESDDLEDRAIAPISFGEITIPSNASYYADETSSMVQQQREEIQEYLMHHFSPHHVSQRDRKEHTGGLANSLEEASENGMKSHPLLAGQQFDGIDPNINPNPVFNNLSAEDYKNIKREQEKEKQLRLGLMPGNEKKIRPEPR